MAAERTAAVVLAAGLSRRFGSDKLLHPFEGKPLAGHIADTLAALPLAHRLAVCPAGNPHRAELFAARGFEVLLNPEPARGMGASLALAARRAADLSATAMLVCLADMPAVTAAHLVRLMAAEGDAVATETAGIATPPALFRRALFPALSALTGGRGARDLLSGATLVPAPPGMTRDSDVPADLSPAR